MAEKTGKQGLYRNTVSYSGGLTVVVSLLLIILFLLLSFGLRVPSAYIGIFTYMISAETATGFQKARKRQQTSDTRLTKPKAQHKLTAAARTKRETLRFAQSDWPLLGVPF